MVLRPVIRRVFKILSVVALVLVAVALWAFFVEPHLLVTHETRLALPGWRDDVRIAVLSDLHVGSAGVPLGQLRKIIDRTNSEKPELVVLLGDFVIGGPRGHDDSYRRHFVEPEVIAEELKRLRAPLGVYAVLGNHDWWYDGDRVGRALTSVGIKVLENQAVRIGQPGFWLGGVADMWTRDPDIPATLSQVDDDRPVLLITHNPDIFPGVPPRVSLTLAGHTHGAQVNLPFYGQLITTSRLGYNAGHFVDHGRNLFVTTGIGTSIVDVRFHVPPEIVILTLTAARETSTLWSPVKRAAPEPPLALGAHAALIPENTAIYYLGRILFFPDNSTQL